MISRSCSAGFISWLTGRSWCPHGYAVYKVGGKVSRLGPRLVLYGRTRCTLALPFVAPLVSQQQF